MRGTVKLEGLGNAMQLLASLPAELTGKRGGPVLAALKAGARIIKDQEAANLRLVTSNATVSGELESTGLLLSSLVISRGRAPTDEYGERVLIRFKRKMYPRKGKPVSTHKVAQLLEYGRKNQNPQPFIRPAFASKAEEAIRVIEADLLRRVDLIVKKLGK